MAKSAHVDLSGQHLELDRIAWQHRDVEAAVKDYFSASNPRLAKRFLGYTEEDLLSERTLLLEEHGRGTSMTVLAALEAAFHIDFLQRCYRREKDAVSTEFLKLYGSKGARVSLGGDILPVWKRKARELASIVADLQKVFKYRHWLAHGRYWVPKSPKYDYEEVYRLAETVLDAFPFKGAQSAITV